MTAMAELRYTLQRAVNRVQAPDALVLDRASMERFLAHCHRRRYPSKTAIIRPGDSANILYFIIEGSVSVMTEDEEGRELILAYINAGEFIGEMGLFVEVPRRDAETEWIRRTFGDAVIEQDDGRPAARGDGAAYPPCDCFKHPRASPRARRSRARRPGRRARNPPRGAPRP